MMAIPKPVQDALEHLQEALDDLNMIYTSEDSLFSKDIGELANLLEGVIVTLGEMLRKLSA